MFLLGNLCIQSKSPFLLPQWEKDILPGLTTILITNCWKNMREMQKESQYIHITKNIIKELSMRIYTYGFSELFVCLFCYSAFK